MNSKNFDKSNFLAHLHFNFVHERMNFQREDFPILKIHLILDYPFGNILAPRLNRHHQSWPGLNLPRRNLIGTHYQRKFTLNFLIFGRYCAFWISYWNIMIFFILQLDYFENLKDFSLVFIAQGFHWSWKLNFTFLTLFFIYFYFLLFIFQMVEYLILNHFDFCFIYGL